MRYPRDMQGYGGNPPAADWPGGAHVAVQFVLNYEEGGENSILHGDAASEAFLSEIPGAQPWPGQRHWNMESIYEYGARAGFWRLRDLFVSRGVPVTVYGVATALARSPAQVAAMQDAGWEIASHGLKWIDYRDHTPEAERADIDEAIRLHTEVTGEAPRGWYTGRTSANTVDLVTETGGFDWISDTYDDDLPYWREHAGRQQLIIPYTLEANDMRFSAGTFTLRRRLLRLPQGHLRHPLRRGRGRRPEDDVRRPALPPRRPPRPRRRPRPLPRLRPRPRQRLDRHPRRHRRPLARPPPRPRHRRRARPPSPATPSSPASAASSSTPPGSPSAPTPSSSAPPTTPPSACTTRSPAPSAPPPSPSASACSPPTPTSPASSPPPSA